MARYGTKRGWAPWRTAFVAAAAGITILGCGKPAAQQTTPPAKSDPQPERAASEVNVDPRFSQPFAEATRKEPPADGQRPPDKTLTGKSVGKLYTEIVQLWDTIRLAEPNGHLLAYTAVL